MARLTEKEKRRRVSVDKRLEAAFKRSRSLGSLDMDSFDCIPAMDEPFAADFSKFDNDSAEPEWFRDTVKAEKQGAFVASQTIQDHDSKVQFDCFGFSLFDSETDGQLAVKPTQVQATLVEPELFLTPEEAEKAARRARRRRSSRNDSHSSVHHSGRSPSASTRRRRSMGAGGGGGLVDNSAPEQVAFSPPKGSGGKLRRSRSTGDGGFEKLKQEQDNAERAARRKSIGDKGISFPKNTPRSRSRHTASRSGKQRSSSESGLRMIIPMDESAGSLESHDREFLEENRHESSKQRRRSESHRRRSLTQQIATKDATGGSLHIAVSEHQMNDSAGRKQRRRSRRSEKGDSSCPSPHKRLVRNGRSLTSLHEQVNSFRDPSSNFQF